MHMNDLLSHALSTGRSRDARRAASAHHTARTTAAAVAVRPATEADITTLVELAGLDSAPVPAGTVLIAEVGGTPQAAIGIENGAIVADPFRRTGAAVRVLRAHAAQARRESRRARAPRYRRALARGAA